MSDNLQKKILLIIFLAFVILFFSTIIFLYIQKNIHLYSFSQNIISYKINSPSLGLDMLQIKYRIYEELMILLEK
jgi:hypothetical protein